MNEVDLIKEVEKRPILYDKSVSGFNKTKLRDDAWKEVQESLNVSGKFFQNHFDDDLVMMGNFGQN